MRCCSAEWLIVKGMRDYTIDSWVDCHRNTVLSFNSFYFKCLTLLRCPPKWKCILRASHLHLNVLIFHVPTFVSSFPLFGPFFRWNKTMIVLQLSMNLITRKRIRSELKRRKKCSFVTMEGSNNNRHYDAHTFHFFGKIHHRHKIKSFGRLVYPYPILYERTHRDYFQCSICDVFVCCCCCCCWFFFFLFKAQFYLEYII